MTYSLLDCTLRDGGSTIGFDFPWEIISRVVEYLDAGGVDFVELGYRSGSGSVTVDHPGPTFHVDDEFLGCLPRKRRIAYTLMIIAAVAKTEDLTFAKQANIDLVRVAAYPHNLQQAFVFLNRAAELGLTCSLNIMASSYVTAQELALLGKQGKDEGAKVIYFADSFGYFLPCDVSDRVERLKGELGIPVGFHAHNNLGCATANTLAAIESGAEFIDASLCGMGRGAGNTQTELWSIVSNRLKLREQPFQDDVLCQIADLVRPLVKNPHQNNALLLSGAANLHAFFWPHISSAAPSDTLLQYRIAFELGKQRPKKVSAEPVREIVTALTSQACY